MEIAWLAWLQSVASGEHQHEPTVTLVGAVASALVTWRYASYSERYTRTKYYPVVSGLNHIRERHTSSLRVDENSY